MKFFSSKNKTIKDNRNFTHIKYVKYDSNSCDPQWVDYNTERKKIYLANSKGYKFINTRLSISTDERLKNDGYSIRLAKEGEMVSNPNDPEWPLNHIVSWDKVPESKPFVAPWLKKFQESEESEFKWRTTEPHSMVKYLEDFLNKLRINGVKAENIKISESIVFYLHKSEIK